MSIIPIDTNTTQQLKQPSVDLVDTINTINTIQQPKIILKRKPLLQRDLIKK